ncbi:MAG: TRAP transporter fused permease subunit [Thermodesulfobacteriota bacterium]
MSVEQFREAAAGGAELELQNEKVKKYLEKEEKSVRKVRGLWHWVAALLMAAMVLFYFYSSGVRPVAAELHRGVYVLITYALVFLLYPAGSRWFRPVLCLVLGTGLSFAGSVRLWFGSVQALDDRVVAVKRLFQDDGLAAGLGGLGSLGGVLAVGVALAAALYVLDLWCDRRFPDAPSLTDVLFGLTSAAVVLYWITQFEALAYRAGAEWPIDFYVSLVGIVISVEVARRVLGWSITLIGVGFVLYCLYGPYMPEIIAHRGFRIERIVNALYLTQDGVFGVMADVLATFVILFIFFGAFLQKSGAGRFFIDLPLAIAGRSAGGPAKVAVIASALFGSISGSAIANTVATGAFTIPMMKRAGFRPHVAGAIEPAASIGGMFMPPVMGAGGFLMAELTGIPYVSIMLMSIFPAFLYFLSVLLMVHFEAKKHNIQGITEDLPKARDILRHEWYMALPLVTIIVLMLLGRSPGFAAYWATLGCLVITLRAKTLRLGLLWYGVFPAAAVLGLWALGFDPEASAQACAFAFILLSWVRRENQMGPKETWEAILTGARNTLIIGATVGVIGMIVGSIALTGIGLKFSDIIISLADGNLLIAIFLICLASLVLGMGVPVTAAYLIVAVLAVPALREMGVMLIAAHQIVYWFSQDSNITPPVCVAAYAGAAIAGSDPWKTGWTSFKFAKLLYVVPLLFAYTPAILLKDWDAVPPQFFSLHDIGFSFFSATVGTVAFSALSMGYLVRRTTLLEWIFFAVATFLCYTPGLVTDATGIAMVAALWWWQKRKNRLEAVAAAA